MTIQEYYDSLPEIEKKGFIDQLKKDANDASENNKADLNNGFDYIDHEGFFGC